MPRCSQDKCRVAETGVCLEGHKQNCPYILPEEPGPDLSPEESDAPAIITQPMPEPQRFHSGEKLTVSEASRLLNDRPSRVVLCAGAQDCGKTTFLARLSEMFRDGSFSRYRFARSLTLCAFERASWLATIASGVARPDTRRTDRRENDTFLHLRVYPKDDPAHQLDILLSDLAGETFPTAVASREFCADLSALARADHLVMFLDSARLVDSARRHSECDNVRTFLQRAGSVKQQPNALGVQVVFSRWDYVIRDPKRAEREKFCEATEADFVSRFGDSFAALNFWRIAARPDGGLQPTNADIQSLFAHWLETPILRPASPPARNSEPARDFCAFGIV